MRLRSFRLRIALLAAALSGGALVGFAGVAWRLIYVAKVSRLDAKLETQVRRTARPRPQDWWQPFVTALPRELRTDSDTPIVLLAVGADGKTVYQSPEWTIDFDLRSLLLPLAPFPSPLPSALSSPSSSSLSSPPPSLQSSASSSSSASPAKPESSLGYGAPGTLPEPRLLSQSTPTGSWRIGVVSSPYVQVAVAVSLQALDQEMAVIRNIFLVAIPGTLLLVAGGAWVVSGSALRPMQKLTTAIQQVTITGLNQRVSVDATDFEFVELIQVFNQMLERLERSFKQSSRFSGDAAHELKTPLAILQGELEQLLYRAEPGSEIQQSLSNLLDEVHRLSGIVRKLLLLSLADAGKMSLHNIEVDLSALLAMIVEDMEMLAPHLDVQTDISEGLWVWGDCDLLTQVLQNLISNAIKYNLPDGWIKIQGQYREQTVQVTITNSSSPIPASDRERIFDRFYRGDPARTRKVEGVGLGLSLSREIARAHQGDLTLNMTSPGETGFTLTLKCPKG